MPEARRDARTYALIGAAMEVHRVLGSGFLEAVYQEVFARELSRREVPFRAEVELPGFNLGMLFNFGASSLQHKRFAFSPK